MGLALLCGDETPVVVWVSVVGVSDAIVSGLAIAEDGLDPLSVVGKDVCKSGDALVEARIGAEGLGLLVTVSMTIDEAVAVFICVSTDGLVSSGCSSLG